MNMSLQSESQTSVSVKKKIKKKKLNKVTCKIGETKMFERRKWAWGSFEKPTTCYFGTLQTTL